MITFCFIYVQHSITTVLGIRVALYKRASNLSSHLAPVIYTQQLKVEEVILITQSALITTVTKHDQKKKKMSHVASASHFPTVYEERN